MFSLQKDYNDALMSVKLKSSDLQTVSTIWSISFSVKLYIEGLLRLLWYASFEDFF